MSQTTLHERLYRTEEGMAKLASARITVCGAGALGANLVETLARVGAGQVRVIDRDRVEEHNLSTQPWQRADIGGQKSKLLAKTLYRAVGAKIEARTDSLDEENATKLLDKSDLVIDCFDNGRSRAAVQTAARALAVPCLHAGMSGDGYGEVVWDERYTVPGAPAAAAADLCDYPLARNLVMLTASICAEVAIVFLTSGERRSHGLTLGDLRLSTLD